MGLAPRTNSLIENLIKQGKSDQAQALSHSTKMLINPEEMGERFKAWALSTIENPQSPAPFASLPQE
eukprot:m.56064 g.56064  ORF g.56064 m.56064 type:complete len:67 (-) comp13680_c0_seq1:1732-1932(-)